MALTLDKTLTKAGDPDPLPELGVVRQRRLRRPGRRPDLFRYQRVAAELAAGRAVGRDGAVDELAGPVHQSRGRAGTAKRGAGHHDREPAAASRASSAPPRPQPLGILPQPNQLPGGCIAAGDRAFFCDYVLDYLARAGINKEQVARGGYLIRTTLDPKVQASVKQAIDKVASPTLDGVASVMSVIKPGKDAHRVMAMASNRTYGFNSDANETVQPQPFSLVGDGAGSIFKIFTTAAALDMGMGINAQLEVPGSFQARGLGSSDTPGCPKETWCVKNAGNYRGSMNVTDALATSPNTAFAKLIQQVGVPRAVDMAVRLGLRSYAIPGTARAYDPESNESLADFIKRQNIGSFTLGPFQLNALELANVAATLASGGTWCPPNPIDKIFDRHGNEVPYTISRATRRCPRDWRTRSRTR